MTWEDDIPPDNSNAFTVAGVRGGILPKPRPCVYEGPIIEECKTCGNKEDRHVRHCLHPQAHWDVCTRVTLGGTAQGCDKCPLYTQQQEPAVSRKPLVWAYGVTSTQVRVDTLLPRTLASLAAAGFAEPRLFIDDCPHELASVVQSKTRLQVVGRTGKLLPYGNWILALVELYIRNPTADRFALFQDDLLACKNLRLYLERWYPAQGYLNLYTNPFNAKQMEGSKLGQGWHQLNYRGLGALGLVFDGATVMTLLMGQRAVAHLVGRPQDPHRGWRSLDGGVVTALKPHGIKEYVHNPSLLQHTGLTSTMDKRSRATGKEAVYPVHTWVDGGSPLWQGEEYDPMSLPVPANA